MVFLIVTSVLSWSDYGGVVERIGDNEHYHSKCWATGAASFIPLGGYREAGGLDGRFLSTWKRLIFTGGFVHVANRLLCAASVVYSCRRCYMKRIKAPHFSVIILSCFTEPLPSKDFLLP